MEPNNRAAVSHYKSFLKSLEKIQGLNRTEKKAAFINTLNAMEFAVKNIKKVEPSYDTSALEHHVLTYKAEHINEDSNKKLNQAIEEILGHIQSLNTQKYPENGVNLSTIDETVRLSTLYVEKQLSIFKNNFPDYTTADFESKINQFKIDYKSTLLATSKHADESTNSLKLFDSIINTKNHIYFTSILDENEKERYDEQARLMLTRDDIVAENEAINRFEKIIRDKQNEINEFINSEHFKFIQSTYLNLNEIGRMSHTESMIQSTLIRFQKEIPTADEILKTGTKILETTIDFLIENYYSLQLNSIMTNFLSTVFNKDEKIAQASAAYQQLLNSHGSIHAYKERILSNKKEYTSDVFMPKSFGSDYEKDEITKTAIENASWRDEILKIVQLNSDFYFEKEAAKTYRVFNSAVATKNQEGVCHVIEVNIKQEFLGSKYGNPNLTITSSQTIKEQNIYR